MAEAITASISTTAYAGTASAALASNSMSPSRRMFCLLALFDCLFTFVMWIIYSKSFSVPDLRKALQNQVTHFKFKSSLFDLVLLAFWRAILLLIAYGLFRSTRVYMIATTTFATTFVIVVKVFFYEWNSNTDKANVHPMDYFIFIFSFLICWGETWHLDFKVLPSEAKLQQRLLQESLPNFGSIRAFGSFDERNPFLNHITTAAWISDQASSFYASPTGTPPDSDTESEFHSVTGHRVTTRPHLSDRDQALVRQGKENFDMTLGLLSMHDGWTLKMNEDGVVVESKFVNGIGNVYRAQAWINVSPSILIERVISDVDSQTKWNPSVTESRILYTVDTHTDICYSVSAGGLVSSRDFVNLRHWQRKGNFYVSSNRGVEYEGMPVNENHVRGENGPGGWIVQDVVGESNKADFVWILNTDLKGWIPSYLVEKALSGVIVDTTKALKHYAESLR